MDLTHFMHGKPARVLACATCGLLRRADPQPASYENDCYDRALLQHLYPRYLDAFKRKRSAYEPLLQPHAEVLEIGSHIGAFLEAAETWGWRPTGLDIGAETSEFARGQGARVKRVALPDYSNKRQPLDAIFIWNCFEQLEDPRENLGAARRLLGRHGLVVLRVPNGEFYRKHIEKAGRRWLPPFGYNNLLAFPYLHGFNLGSLKLLLRSAGFEPVAAFGASVLTPPYPDLSPSLRVEWTRIEKRAQQAPPEDSPWIEVVGRAIEGFTSRVEQ